MAANPVRGRRAPIPITLVTGPRGAGKTTLINRLLAAPEFANTVVILNDFGEVTPTGGMVEKAEDGFIALGSGCVCCTVRGALADGLERLLRALDNGRIAAIGRVVIEADEAADPAAILAAVERHPYLSLRFAPDGIVAVLDDATAAAVLATRAATVRQMAMADVVALSRHASARALISALNPLAAVVAAESVDAADLVGHGAFDPAIDGVGAWIAPVRETPAPALNGEAARIRSFAVERATAMSIVAVDRFVDYLGALQGPNLIRVRGIVATGEGEAVIVEGLGPFFRPPLIVDTPSTVTRFAVTSRDLDRRLFEGYLDAFLNEARIDAPDRAALTENPLAIPGFRARSGR